MDIKIIVATHKKYKMPESDMYLPLQVGAANSEPIGYITDDTGDNISDKNDTYCELTGLYYAWKNLDYDYSGLVHYRRYFACANYRIKRIKDKDLFHHILSIDEARDIFATHDLIVPSKRRYYIESLYSHYDHTLDGRHLRVAYKIIVKNFPEYIGACNRVYHRSWGYMFNMFVGKREFVDAYCTWLFSILSMMEDYIDTDNLSAFDKRLFGRVSEILFNVYLEYHKDSLKIREVKCINMERVNWLSKGASFLGAKFLGNKYSKSF